MKKIIFLLVVVSIVVAAAMLLISRKAEVASLTVPAKHYVTVETVKPAQRSVIQSRSFLATIHSAQRTQIATKYSSMVKSIPVHESLKVNKGDLLVQLDSSDVQRLIDALKVKTLAMESEVAVTAKRHQSNETLYRGGAISEDIYDSSRLLLENKKAQLEEIRANLKIQKEQLQYYAIRAPHNGVIGTVSAYAGDLAVPGKVLLTVHSGKKIARFTFPSAVSINKNSPVLSKGKPIGKVALFYADAVQGLYEAEVALNSEMPFIHGEMIPVEIIRKSVTHCSVPSGVLLQTKGIYQVMQYSNETFTPFTVDVIAQNDEFSAITPCPEHEVALAPQTKLASLPFLDNITISSRQ